MMELWSLQNRLDRTAEPPTTAAEMARADELASFLLEQVAEDLRSSRNWLESAKIFGHLVHILMVALLVLNRRSVGRFVLAPFRWVASLGKKVHENV